MGVCFPESAAWSWGWSAPACRPYSKWRLTTMRSESSPSTGQTSPGSETSERSEPTTSPSATSSAVGSHVRTYPRPGPWPASTRESVLDSGVNLRASFASYDPVTRCWRTSQLSLVEGLDAYSETWPRSGMMRSGTVFRQTPSAPPSTETVGFVWPTPRAVEGGAWQAKDGRRFLTLAGAVRMWPRGTPDWSNTAFSGPFQGITNGLPSPTFVEWLMGFPAGWSSLE